MECSKNSLFSLIILNFSCKESGDPSNSNKGPNKSSCLISDSENGKKSELNSLE